MILRNEQQMRLNGEVDLKIANIFKLYLNRIVLMEIGRSRRTLRLVSIEK